MVFKLTDEALCSRFAELSPRQFEMLRLHAAYKTAKEIALALKISEYTVRAHTAEVRLRLGCATIREAAMLLARYDRLCALVNDGEPRSRGMAGPEANDALSLHVHERLPIPVDDEPDDAFNVERGGTRLRALGHTGAFSSGLIWLHVRLNALTTPKWCVLTGVTSMVILVVTAGILAGAGAILQTLQDFSVRLR